MSKPGKDQGRSQPRSESRRRFLTTSSTLAMSAGLVGGYGAFGLIAGRFLYPARPLERRWMFVTEAGALRLGDSILYEAPSGETINVVRQSDGGGDDDFMALGSVCPHLGCQVKWEAHNDRYFCPCHNGVFDAAGIGVAGPPGDAGLNLPRYDLKVEAGLLYIHVPVETLHADAGEGRVIEKAGGIHGPGHDPCLASRRGRGGSTGETG